MPETPKTLEEIEETLKVAKTEVAEIGAGVRALAEIDLTKAPPIDTNAREIQALGVGVLAGAEGEMTRFQTALTEMMEVTGAQQERTTKGVLDWVKGLAEKRAEVREAQPTQVELTTQIMEQFGLTPETLQRRQGLIGQLTVLSGQTVDLQTQLQLGQVAIEQRLMGRPGVIVRGEQALLERQYNIKIAAKAAQAGVIAQQLQLERGLFQDAMAMTSMVVQATTFDQAQQLADLDWAFDTYKDLYTIMEAAEIKEWDRSYTLAKDELDRQQTDITNKMNLLTDAAKIGVNLNWDMNYIQSKTLTELTSEYSKRVAAKKAEPPIYAPSEIEKEWLFLGGEVGTGMTKQEYFATRKDITIPRDWTDEELRARTRELQNTTNPLTNELYTYQEALDQLTISVSIRNKDRAMFIVAEVYGITPEEEIPSVPVEEEVEYYWEGGVLKQRPVSPVTGAPTVAPTAPIELLPGWEKALGVEPLFTE